MNTVKSDYHSVKSYPLDLAKKARAAGGSSPYLRNATISRFSENGAKKEASPPLKKPVAPCSVVDKIDYTACLEVTGSVIQLLECSKPVKTGSTHGKKSSVSTDDVDLSEEERQARKERNDKESARRKKKKLFNIMNINFYDAEQFLTLTFKDDIDIQPAQEELSKFFDRIKKRYPDLQYVWILELQASGRPHYHLLVKGFPPEFLEKRYYVKTKKKSGLFQFLQENNVMGRDFSKIRFFDTKKAAKRYAMEHGLDVAYSSPLVKDWKQGFVNVRPLICKDGETPSDLFGYFSKYMAKDGTLPKGVHSYNFSRGNLRQKPFRLLNDAASKLFAWFQQHIAEFIKHTNQYASENVFLGQWRKTYLTIDRGFMQELLPDIESWFATARDTWGHDAAFHLKAGEATHFPDIGITNKVLCGLA